MNMFKNDGDRLALGQGSVWVMASAMIFSYWIEY